MKITVTQEDIRDGRKGSCSRCPVARAMYRALGINHGGDDYVIVGVTGYAHVGNTLQDASKVVALPREVNLFIHRFDTDRWVEPFEFEVAL